MNSPQENQITSPVSTNVVKRSFNQFEQQLNNNDEPSIQMTNKSDQNLESINDHCLLEIFSLKILDPMDFCSLAETHPRFKQMAQRVFPTKFTELNFDFFILEGKGYYFEWNRTRNIERVFENFGSCLSVVSVRNQSVLKLVAMYCGDNLKSLTMGKINIPDVLTVRLKPIFKQLQKLDVNGVTFDTNLFADCDSLIELSIHSCDAILENTFPTLERFRFYINSDSYLLRFLSRHKSLKAVVTYYDTKDGIYHFPILQTIGWNCQELEELTIIVRDNYYFPNLLNLRQLKTLRIYSNSDKARNHLQWIRQMKSLKSLETLELSTVSEDNAELFPALSQLKKLRELHLYFMSGGPTFPQQFALLSQLRKIHINILKGGIHVILYIIRLVVSLEVLQVDYFEPITNGLTKEDFSEIINLVEGRSKALTLKCNIRFSYDSKSCDKKQKLKFVPLR